MTWTFNDSDRFKPAVTVTVDIDPAESTVALIIDDVEHPCSWTGDATQNEQAGTWTRRAVTDGYLAGPAVPTASIDGATVLDYGAHKLEVIVTTGPTIKAADLPSFRITE